MSDLMRWDPFAEMLSLRRAMDRMFEDAALRGRGGEEWGGQGLDLDIYEQDDDLVVTAGLPGVKPADVDITVQGNLLTIRGERREESESGRGRYHRRERRYGSFIRQVQLPVAVQTEQGEARFEDGVLRLTLPKAEEARQRRIQVSSGESSQIGTGQHGGEGEGPMPRKTQEIPVESGSGEGTGGRGRGSSQR